MADTGAPGAAAKGDKAPELKYRGLTTIAARRALVAVTEACLDQMRGREQSPMTFARTLVRERAFLALEGVAALYLAAYLIVGPRNSRAVVELLIPAVLVLASTVAGAVVWILYKRCWAEEVRRRLGEVLRDYRSACERAERQLTEPTRPRRGQAASPILQGCPQVAIVSAYRDGQWQRVPKLLLAENDVVALMAGDAAPAAAELLQFDGATLASLASSPPIPPPPQQRAVGFGVAGGVPGVTEAPGPAVQGSAALPLAWDTSGARVGPGERIQLRPGAQLQFARRALVPATSPTLLVLCGDMRCFRLLETPLVAHLRQAVTPPSALGSQGVPAGTDESEHISASRSGHARGGGGGGGFGTAFGTPARRMKFLRSVSGAAASPADPDAATSYRPTLSGVRLPPCDPPEPLLSRRVRYVSDRVAVAAFAAALLTAIAGAGRVAFDPPSRGSWSIYLLSQPAALLMCILPVSVLAWAAAAEAALTARLLAYFEMALRQRRGRLVLRRQADNNDKRDSVADVAGNGFGMGIGNSTLSAIGSVFAPGLGNSQAGHGSGSRSMPSTSSFAAAAVAATPARLGESARGGGGNDGSGDVAGDAAKVANNGQGAVSMPTPPTLSKVSEERSMAAVVAATPAGPSPAITPPFTPRAAPSNAGATDALGDAGTAAGAANVTQPAGAGAAAAAPAAASDDEFDEFDVDERQKAVSAAEVSVSLPRFLSYFEAVWRQRWGFSACPDALASAAAGAASAQADGNGSGPSGSRGFLRTETPVSQQRRWWQMSFQGSSQGANSRPWSGSMAAETHAAPQLPKAPLLPVPLLRCRALERLGASTMLAFLDEDTTCEPHSTAQEIFLLDGKDDAITVGNGGGGGGDNGGGGSGVNSRRTVLDLHSRAAGSVGFDDPRWWAHLPALKPVGLTCLMAESRSAAAAAVRSNNNNRRVAAAGGANTTVTGGFGAPGNATGTSEEHAQKHWRRPDKALLDHVRQGPPMEHLKRLAREIGFTDADRNLFRERRRIHVINPRLAAHRAMEDAHAQSQEETRRRGTIQPHVQGVVVEDRRTRALQLLCSGNPTLLLGMCADYWDGGTISPIPPALRRMMLDMHQQWSLEDLDVVAFGYAPVPYTVQPFVSTHSKTPEYLVWAREATPVASRGRQRGTPTGGHAGAALNAASATNGARSPEINSTEAAAAAAIALASSANDVHERIHHQLRPVVSSPLLALAPVAESEGAPNGNGGSTASSVDINGPFAGSSSMADLSGLGGSAMTLDAVLLSRLHGGDKGSGSIGAKSLNAAASGGSFALSRGGEDAAAGGEKSPPTQGIQNAVGGGFEPGRGGQDAAASRESFTLAAHGVQGSPESSVGVWGGSAGSEPDAHAPLPRFNMASPTSVKSSPGPVFDALGGSPAISLERLLPASRAFQTDAQASPPTKQQLQPPATSLEGAGDQLLEQSVAIPERLDVPQAARSRGVSDTAVAEPESVRVPPALSPSYSSPSMAATAGMDDDTPSSKARDEAAKAVVIGDAATKDVAGALLPGAKSEETAHTHGNRGDGNGANGAVGKELASSLLRQAVLSSSAMALKVETGAAPAPAPALAPAEAKATISSVEGRRRFSIDDFGLPRLRQSHHHHHRHPHHHHRHHRHAGLAQRHQTQPAEGQQQQQQRQPQRQSHTGGRQPSQQSLAGQRDGMDGRGEHVATALWNLMHDQVFLGMVASSVAPKREVPALIEDMMASCVRFVYFSPRNMRRSKALAEEMGIETDWNCAISLRALEEPNTPDPHRMITEYADWDVKARLPHGLPAIKEHIRRVDNVPLLVSLFTDATPDAVDEMIRVSQEHAESIMAVGSANRSSNARLMRQADISLSQEGLPANQSLLTLPAHAPAQLSAADVAFNARLVGLFAALPLGDATRRAGGVGEAQAVLIDLVREGRRLLNNISQALVFWLTSCTSLALLVLLAAALPVSRPPQLFNLQLLWLLWAVLPLLTLPLLTASADSGLMRRAPEKNQERAVAPTGRHAMYLLLRAAPAALGAMALYPYVFGSLLKSADEQLLARLCGKAAGSVQAEWSDAVWCDALAHGNAPTVAWRASAQATDLAFCEAVLCLAAQTANFLHRSAPLRRERPYRNRFWVISVAAALLLQALFVVVSAAIRRSFSMLGAVPWPALVAGALWPGFVVVLGEAVKRHDAKAHGRYVTLLRLEFETRLGMYSPR